MCDINKPKLWEKERRSWERRQKPGLAFRSDLAEVTALRIAGDSLTVALWGVPRGEAGWKNKRGDAVLGRGRGVEGLKRRGGGLIWCERGHPVCQARRDSPGANIDPADSSRLPHPLPHPSSRYAQGLPRTQSAVMPGNVSLSSWW